LYSAFLLLVFLAFYGLVHSILLVIVDKWSIFALLGMADLCIDHN